MKPTVVFDIEIYKNYLLVAFLDINTRKTRTYEAYDGKSIDVADLQRVLKNCKLISFNGVGFDVPLLAAIVQGHSVQSIKDLADAIIVQGLKPWQLDLPELKLDHIDLLEVAPGQASLKLYGGRLHCRRLQDLPIEPNALISPDQREELRSYCLNDLETTEALYRALMPQLELREKMSVQYGQNLMSKSDAQIAEAVIKKEVMDITGKQPKRPNIPATFRFKYRDPGFISFKTEQLISLYEKVLATEFSLNSKGSVTMPEWFDTAAITISESTYKLGIGGLHSTESERSLVRQPGMVLRDSDVTGMYPSMMLFQKLYPVSTGPAFVDVFSSIVKRRAKAKHSGDKVTADSLKLTNNSTYGKLGSKYSFLYSPNLVTQVTLTGQLCLLMLIERLELSGISVVSANTDGIVTYFPEEMEPVFAGIAEQWSKEVGLDLEHVEYQAIHNRDVNSYIAIKPDGSVKTKGAFAYAGLSKNPANEICIDAVINFLTDSTPIERTIELCKDIRKFVSVKRVTGGAVKDGVFLGKAIRWYYAKGETGTINYLTNGNTVGRSLGAKPLMEMDGTLPGDIDYDWYINEAKELLMDLAVWKRPEKLPPNREFDFG